MTFAVAWLVFPLVLAALSYGCGKLLEAVAGVALPQALVLPLGWIVISLTTLFAQSSDATASLQTPAVVALALCGIGFAVVHARRPRVDWWLAGAAASAFAFFAAPVVLSGRATFAGYIKLDDTATYLAMLDRAMHHGYNVAGLAHSTYELTLRTSLLTAYPLGSLLPLGIGSTLLGRDPAWLWQPYLTFLAALIALVLYQLVAGLVRMRWLRATVAAVAVQAALLYGYALWGGIKELATAVIAGTAVVLVVQLRLVNGARAIVPLAATAAALPGVLSAGGMAWIAVPLGIALVLALRSGIARGLVLAAVFVAESLVLAIPTLIVTSSRLHHSGAFTGSQEMGNLIRPLRWFQVFGVWIDHDFRVAPEHATVTYVLIAIVAAALAVAVALAWQRRVWEIAAVLGTVALAMVVYVGFASPWIAGKAIATSSPFVLGVALAGVAAAFELGRRLEAGVAGALIVAGVIWSNALQYQGVTLAPSGRLSELAAIGKTFAGDGPALLTEFESYGARHFLRRLDPEATAELRYDTIPLRSGGEAAFGSSPDIDEIDLAAILHFRTLVTRRQATASRPPSPYARVWAGKDYEVWQRTGRGQVLEHLSLGSRYQPAAVPGCGEVLRLAREARADGGVIATVERPPVIVINPDDSSAAPTSFGSYGEDAKAVYLHGPATFALPFTISRKGVYRLWIGGSFASRLSTAIDDESLGSRRGETTWPGMFTGFGSLPLSAGAHILRLHYAGPDLSPGSAAVEFGLGPFVVAPAAGPPHVTYVAPARARSLCGKSLDWIEVVRRPQAG